ncbi:MAG: efflux RND transporter periplasmic adaptor subunit [Chloroflexi bacterium]|jgi:HlyD family secretion protein|nr:efflux RND transporter periplasmic adaptor subunit [Chloroflexota bacterium]
MRKRVIAVIVIVVVAALGFLIWQGRAQSRDAVSSNYQTVEIKRGPLVATIGATGVVRANQTAVLAWQTSGTVGSIHAAVGDLVSAGDVLASLQSTSLPQQVILAQAELVEAQRALEDLLNSDLQRATALKAVEDARRALEDARDSGLSEAEAQKAVADAQKAVQEAERRLRNAQSPASQSYIDEAEAQVVLARDALERAQERFRPYADKPEDNLTRARLQTELAAAQQQYDAAVRYLNSLKGTTNDTDLAVLQADLEAARAQLAAAEREYERIKSGAADADIALLEAQLADAEREYERLKNGTPEEDILAAQARVDAAQATLNQAYLIAPFDAVVTDVTSMVGDQVTPGTVGMRLDDLSRLLLDVQVSEVDVNFIQVGQDVSLSFDAIQDREYQGRVVEVALVGTSNQGVVDFTVTVELTDPDENVRPGMTAAVNIITRELEDVLLVPNRAVRILDGKRVVYVLENGTLTPVTITLGASSELESQILEGDLAEGDLVVTNPPAFQGGQFGF